MNLYIGYGRYIKLASIHGRGKTVGKIVAVYSGILSGRLFYLT